MYCEATSRYNTHPPFPTFKQIFTNILTSFLLATYLFYLRPRKFNRKFHLCFFCISTRPFPRAWPSLLLRECNAWLVTICTESEGKPVSPFRGIINKHVLLWVCLPFFFLIIIPKLAAPVSLQHPSLLHFTSAVVNSMKQTHLSTIPVSLSLCFAFPPFLTRTPLTHLAHLVTCFPVPSPSRLEALYSSPLAAQHFRPGGKLPGPNLHQGPNMAVA